MRKVLMLTLCAGAMLMAQAKRAMTVEDLWKMKRVSNLAVSSDGKYLAYAVKTFNVEANKGNSDIYIMNSDGSNLKPFKASDKNESEPVFTPDSKSLTFVRDGNIYSADIQTGTETQLTNLSTGASGIVWSKDGSKFLFVSSVYPECLTDQENKDRAEKEEKSKVKAKLFTELMYRHWDGWRGETRSHLFLYDSKTKEAVDLTLKSTKDVPPLALGSEKDYAFSPDGNKVLFTMNPDAKIEISTNNDIFVIDLKDLKKGEAAPYTKISTSKGDDCYPSYSPDGKFIAFLSMKRANYEADEKDIVLYDVEKKSYTNLTDKFDLTVEEYQFSADGKTIYFACQNEVNRCFYKIDVQSKKIEMLIKDNYNTEFTVLDNKVFFIKQKTTLPSEVFVSGIDGKNVTRLTNTNNDILGNLDLKEQETFWFTGANGQKVQAQMIKPPFFDETKKYPVILLIHGGPQGAWEDNFHYRWNVQMFASFGYVVIAPNIRGSIGYGQKFTDGVNKDWGGKPYVDAMNCVDFAIKNFKFVDAKNLFAAGASYGGYMMNWIGSHTDRFNAIVTHAGVYNLESMYGATEELWFPEWENGGTPWENRAAYQKFSPHQYAKNFKSPMLVVHGGFDFRVPEGQAFELFTTLQRRGIESKFLYFPDETHFISKPQNAFLWWNTIQKWFNEHRK